MKRAGFTMIELIFVIVILGILAAVALPKFIGVSEQAEAGKCKGFIGTMNRTVGPALWGPVGMGDSNASVAFTAAKMTSQIAVPSQCGVTAAEIMAGAVTTGTVKTAIAIGDGLYEIKSIAGTTSASPTWTWTKTN